MTDKIKRKTDRASTPYERRMAGRKEMNEYEGKYPDRDPYTEYWGFDKDSEFKHKIKRLRKSELRRHDVVYDQSGNLVSPPGTASGLVDQYFFTTPQSVPLSLADLALETTATGIGEASGNPMIGAIAGLGGGVAINRLAKGRLPKGVYDTPQLIHTEWGKDVSFTNKFNKWRHRNMIKEADFVDFPNNIHKLEPIVIDDTGKLMHLPAHPVTKQLLGFPEPKSLKELSKTDPFAGIKLPKSLYELKKLFNKITGGDNLNILVWDRNNKKLIETSPTEFRGDFSGGNYEFAYGEVNPSRTMKLLTDEKPITMAQSLFNDKWLAENMFRIIDEKAGQGLKEIEKKAGRPLTDEESITMGYHPDITGNVDDVGSGSLQQFAYGNWRMSDIDTPNPFDPSTGRGVSHDASQIGAQDAGEAVEHIQRYVRDNPQSAIDFYLTPGGFRLFDISQAAQKSRTESVNVFRDYYKWLTGTRTDKKYTAMEMSRMARDLYGHLRLQKGLTPNVQDFLNKHMQEVFDLGNPSSKYFDPEKLAMTTEVGPLEFGSGFRQQSSARLSAKTDRMLGLEEGFRTKQAPPFTAQKIGRLSGSESVLSQDAIRAVQTHDDIIAKLRYAQGIDDPLNPGFGKGVLDDSGHGSLGNAMRSMSPSQKDIINKALQLGVVPPFLGGTMAEGLIDRVEQDY